MALGLVAPVRPGLLLLLSLMGLLSGRSHGAEVQPWLWNSTDVALFFSSHGLNVTSEDVDRVGVTGQSILDGLVDTATINKLGMKWDKGVRGVLRAIEALRDHLPPPKDVREWQQRNRKLAFWFQTMVEPSRFLFLWLRFYSEEELPQAALARATGPVAFLTAPFFPSYPIIRLYGQTPFRTLWVDYMLLSFLWTKLCFEIAILLVHLKQRDGLYTWVLWMIKDEAQNIAVGYVVYYVLVAFLTPYLFDLAFSLEAFAVLPLFTLGRCIITYQLLFPASQPTYPHPHQKAQ